ncbi:hypothetical protein V6N13_047094 [Hibiscus sabdariffa]
MHHYKVINSSGGDKLANEKEINVIGRGVLLKSGSENHTLFFIGFCSTRDHVTNAMIEELFDTISVERSLEDSVANVLFSNMHDGSSVGMSTMPDQGLGAPEISILAKFNEWLAGRDDGAELVRHDSIVSVSSKCSSAQFPDNHVHSNYSTTSNHCVILMDTTLLSPRVSSIYEDHCVLKIDGLTVLSVSTVRQAWALTSNSALDKILAVRHNLKPYQD